MLCQRCKKNEATVRLLQNVNGIKSELVLCSECANKENNDMLFPSDLFSGFFSDSIFGSYRREEQKKCPKCGLTKSGLASSGRPGCAECYNFFAEELDRIIYGIHGNARHNGSAPGKRAEQIAKQKEIEALKDEQRKAVEAQDYEKAAELRDKIKALESGEEGK